MDSGNRVRGTRGRLLENPLSRLYSQASIERRSPLKKPRKYPPAPSNIGRRRCAKMPDGKHLHFTVTDETHIRQSGTRSGAHGFGLTTTGEILGGWLCE